MRQHGVADWPIASFCCYATIRRPSAASRPRPTDGDNPAQQIGIALVLGFVGGIYEIRITSIAVFPSPRWLMVTSLGRHRDRIARK